MQLSKTMRLALGASLLALAYSAGRFIQPAAAPVTASGVPQALTEAEVWTCSMDPQVRLPEPGKCPICSMDLILAESGSGSVNELSPSSLQLSENAMALADIQTAPVERRSVAHEVSLVGKIAFDETRLAYITSWVSGRLDRLFVDYTGVTVRANDHLVEIYSPTLYSAQQELLQALATAKKLENSSLEIVRSSNLRTVISTREKLRLYGLGEEQIEAIITKGEPDEHITILAPFGGVVVKKQALEGMYVEKGTLLYTIADLSKLWVLLDAYESDLAWLRYGQDVEFTVEAYPGERFHGRVAFIDPLLSARTRTVKVRLNVDNRDGRLKPDMFVSATAQAVLTAHGKVVDEDLADKWMCPMHPEVIAEEEIACPECGMSLVSAAELGFVAPTRAEESLVIPATAPLITGKRAVVYVRLADRQRPTFEGREIELGPRAGEWYVVRSGLAEGELVVVKGNFKIDSELQIRARPSMMNPAGLARRAADELEHDRLHDEREHMPAEPMQYAAPQAFREQLGALLDAYIELQLVLSSDEDGPASAQRIVDRLAAVDMKLLEGAGHGAWMQQLPELKKSARDLAGAWNLGRRRILLGPLTDRLVLAVKSFGYTRAQGDVAVFLCPMAIDGDPASWIQVGEEASNPYMGSSMLGCGSFTELLNQDN